MANLQQMVNANVVAEYASKNNQRIGKKEKKKKRR
jgi:hypothetical protein